MKLAHKYPPTPKKGFDLECKKTPLVAFLSRAAEHDSPPHVKICWVQGARIAEFCLHFSSLFKAIAYFRFGSRPISLSHTLAILRMAHGLIDFLIGRRPKNKETQGGQE